MLFFDNKKYFLNVVSFLCACIVPLLVTGPFLPDFLLSILSLWFLYYSFKNKIYSIYKNRYFLIFLSFCLICTVSSLISVAVTFSLKSSFFYIRVGIFALLISYLIDQKTKILDYFYYIFLITFSILIFDGYLQFFTGFNVLGYSLHPTRVSSFFHNKLILGSYLTRLFPLLLALFIVRNNKKKLEIFYFFFLFLLTDILVFLSGERASFLFFNLSSIFIIFFLSKYKKLRLFMFILAYCVITFIIFNNKLIYNRYITSVINNLEVEKKDKDSRILFFSEIHDGYARTSINMFLDKPVLGHGPNLFRIKCSDLKYSIGPTSCNIHPHNFYVQLAAETGIIGLSFLIGTAIYFIFLICKHVYKNLFFKEKFLSDYQICLLAGLLITIWPITTNGNFFNNHLMLLYSLQMGFFRKNI
jgi:O-antigen ligase